mgnify:CR=1 FL=1
MQSYVDSKAKVGATLVTTIFLSIKTPPELVLISNVIVYVLLAVSKNSCAFNTCNFNMPPSSSTEKDDFKSCPLREVLPLQVTFLTDILKSLPPTVNSVPLASYALSLSILVPSVTLSAKSFLSVLPVAKSRN